VTKGIKADSLLYDAKSYYAISGVGRDTARLEGRPPNYCRVWKFRNEKVVAK